MWGSQNDLPPPALQAFTGSTRCRSGSEHLWVFVPQKGAFNRCLKDLSPAQAGRSYPGTALAGAVKKPSPFVNWPLLKAWSLFKLSASRGRAAAGPEKQPGRSPSIPAAGARGGPGASPEPVGDEGGERLAPKNSIRPCAVSWPVPWHPPLLSYCRDSLSPPMKYEFLGCKGKRKICQESMFGLAAGTAVREERSAAKRRGFHPKTLRHGHPPLGSPQAGGFGCVRGRRVLWE